MLVLDDFVWLLLVSRRFKGRPGVRAFLEFVIKMRKTVFNVAYDNAVMSFIE